MALESLQWEDAADFTHEPRHDLESLFYVILTICTYVDSPGCLRSPIPVEDERSLCLNEWWDTLDGNVLARNKASHMTSLEHCVLQRLPPYWADFHEYLIELCDAIWPGITMCYTPRIRRLTTNFCQFSPELEIRTMTRAKFHARMHPSVRSRRLTMHCRNAKGRIAMPMRRPSE